MCPLNWWVDVPWDFVKWWRQVEFTACSRVQRHARFKRTPGTMSRCVHVSQPASVNTVTRWIRSRRTMTGQDRWQCLGRCSETPVTLMLQCKNTSSPFLLFALFYLQQPNPNVSNAFKNIGWKKKRQNSSSEVKLTSVNRRVLHASVVEQKARAGQATADAWGVGWWWEQTRATWGPPWQCSSPPAVCPAVYLCARTRTLADTQ